MSSLIVEPNPDTLIGPTNTNDNDELWDNAIAAYTEATRFIRNVELSHLDYTVVANFHSGFIAIRKSTNCIAMIHSFFKTCDQHFRTMKEVDDSVAFLLQHDKMGKWLIEQEHADYVVGLLQDHFGEEAMAVITDYLSLELSIGGLTVAQWENYIAEYDMFKNVPVEWLNNML